MSEAVSNIVTGLISGVISGVFASLIFMIVMYNFKPRVAISKEMSKSTPASGNAIYCVKVVNHSRFMINNVQYALYYCQDIGDGRVDIVELQPRKPKLTTLPRCQKGNNDLYAVRISYEIDTTKYPLDDRKQLRFTFVADHSVSNATICKEAIYDNSKIVEGTFETKKSMTILRRT